MEFVLAGLHSVGPDSVISALPAAVLLVLAIVWRIVQIVFSRKPKGLGGSFPSHLLIGSGFFTGIIASITPAWSAYNIDYNGCFSRTGSFVEYWSAALFGFILLFLGVLVFVAHLKHGGRDNRRFLGYLGGVVGLGLTPFFFLAVGPLPTPANGSCPMVIKHYVILLTLGAAIIYSIALVRGYLDLPAGKGENANADPQMPTEANPKPRHSMLRRAIPVVAGLAAAALLATAWFTLFSTNDPSARGALVQDGDTQILTSYDEEVAYVRAAFSEGECTETIHPNRLSVTECSAFGIRIFVRYAAVPEVTDIIGQQINGSVGFIGFVVAKEGPSQPAAEQFLVRLMARYETDWFDIEQCNADDPQRVEHEDLMVSCAGEYNDYFLFNLVRLFGQSVDTLGNPDLDPSVESNPSSAQPSESIDELESASSVDRDAAPRGNNLADSISAGDNRESASSIAPPELRTATAGVFNASSYPSRALRENREGVVSFELVVGINGRVETCRIISSSGHSDLDGATCRLAVRRMRFDPARDTNGNATEGSWSSTVRWQIPG